MDEFVANTHALFWYLTGNFRLGNRAREIFLAGEKGQARIYLPSIVLTELYYLNEKLGRPLRFAEEFARIADASQFVFIEFRAEDLLNFDLLTAIPERHDRMIAGVAWVNGCPCLTCDPFIVDSGLLDVVWDEE